ncbi:MAG: peptidoglycan -binding protein [Acetobacteraceae bacterium]
MDALSTLLMVVIFVLLVFVLAQMFLSIALSGRNKALQQLNQEVAGLSDMLALEKSHTAALQLSVSQLTSQLQTEHAAKDSLARQLAALQAVEAKAVSARDAALGAKATLAAELADAELRLKSGNTRLAELQAELATAGGRADTAEQASKATNAKLVSTAAELAAAAKRLADMRAEMAQLDREVKVNEATVAARLSDLTELSEQVQALQALRDSLEKKAEAAAVRATTEAERRAATAALLASQKNLADSAVAKIALLNEQVAALRNQLASISAALDLSAKEDKAKGVQIAELGRKLNAALAAKVQKLELYRSEFFGKLRRALADQPGIRVVGDRFVLQNEVLFPIGSADLTPEGKLRIIEVALTLQQIDRKIPPDLHWILQVEGYTDATPINTPQYPSNWELSAQRAINVVQLLIQQGIPPDRLVAVGFGDTHPLDSADTPAAYAKNRRIEFRLSNY